MATTPSLCCTNHEISVFVVTRLAVNLMDASTGRLTPD
jgi:hypothetical protein